MNRRNVTDHGKKWTNGGYEVGYMKPHWFDEVLCRNISDGRPFERGLFRCSLGGCVMPG